MAPQRKRSPGRIRQVIGRKILEGVFGKEKAHALIEATKFQLLNQDSNRVAYGIGEDYQKLKAERQADYRLQFPWLYPGSQFFGTPRDTDVIENRRLATVPIFQLCVGTVQEEIKKLKWTVVKADMSEKQMYRDMPFQDRDVRTMRKKAQEARGDPDTAEPVDSLSQLLSKPNENDQSFSQLTGGVAADTMEVGDAVWVLTFQEGDIDISKTESFYRVSEVGKKKRYPEVRKGARPVAIMMFDSLQFNRDFNKYGITEGFVHVPYISSTNSANSNMILFSKEEIMWFCNDLRPNRYYGYSDTEKSQDLLDILMLTIEQETNYFAEGMISPGALALTGEGWSDDKVEAMKREIEEEVRGRPERFLIFNRDAKWINFSYNYRDLQMLERQLWLSKQIAGNCKLNLRIVGLGEEHGNRATAYAEIEIAHEKGIGPRVKHIEHVINSQLAWRFYGEDIMFLFEPNLTPEEMRTHMDIAIAGYQGGLKTQNEARKMNGDDEVEGGDEFKAEPEPFGGGDFGFDNFGGGGGGGAYEEESQAGERPDEDEDEKRASKSEKAVTPDDVGESEVVLSDAEKLRRDVAQARREFFDMVINELEKHKGLQLKVLNLSTLQGIVAQAITSTGMVTKIVDSVMKYAGKEYIAEMSETSNSLNMEFDEPTMVSALSRLREQKEAYYSTDTFSPTVIQVLQDSIEKDRGVQETIDSLKTLREDFSTYRAETIAVTELGRARRTAVNDFVKEHKDLLEKEWIATSPSVDQGGRTRRSHWAMHRKTVGADEPFMVDYSLDNPKYGLIPENIPGDSKFGINCRCKLQAKAKRAKQTKEIRKKSVHRAEATQRIDPRYLLDKTGKVKQKFRKKFDINDAASDYKSNLKTEDTKEK